MRIALDLPEFRRAWSLASGEADLIREKKRQQYIDTDGSEKTHEWTELDRKQVGNYVLLEAVPDAPRLVASGRRTATEASLGRGCVVHAAGRCLLLPQDIRKLLAATRAKSVVLVRDNGGVVAKLPGGTVRWATPDPAGFPAPSAPEFPGSWAVAAGEFARLVALAGPCCDRKASRYALSGVLLEFAAGRLNAVAADGVRLAHAHASAAIEGEPYVATSAEQAPVVPRRALERAASLCEHAGAGSPLARVSFAPGVFRCTFEGVGSVLSPLVAGRFPAWRDHLPPDPGAGALHFARAGDLARLLDQASIVRAPEHRGVEARASGGVLTLSASTPQVGSCRLLASDLRAEGEHGPLTFDPGLALPVLRELAGLGDEPISLSLLAGRVLAIRARDFCLVVTGFMDDPAPARPGKRKAEPVPA